MSYKRHKYGITKIIKNRFNNLQINWDYITTLKSKHPVLLFTPDMKDTNNHYHIPLTVKQAIKLRDWLNDFIEDKSK